MPSVSITESPNELTMDIDVAGPAQIVRLLRASDAQIASGYLGYPALSDDVIVQRIVGVIEWATPLIGRKDAAIVISGAGTSGRLAMFAARTFNRWLARQGRHPNFHYLMAGGNLALIKAQEKAEDDPHQAWKDLQPRIADKKRVLYVGITCAFAAPYVASQLWHLSDRPRAHCVLIGFNPEDRARTTEIEGWDKTFADVMQAISGRPNCAILNPVVGPEPITGSTRMKGGSGTKLLLELVFALAMQRAGLAPRRTKSTDIAGPVRECLYDYERARIAAYVDVESIASLIRLGGHALREGRRVYYVGSGTPGLLGIIDASECPPTFGAGFDDVRGFLAGGWKELLGPGLDLSTAGAWYRIALNDFFREQVPAMARDALVVVLPHLRMTRALADAVERSRRAGAAVALVDAWSRDHGPVAFDAAVRLAGVPRPILPGVPAFHEFATKLVLNAVTTGAHVLCGKVYRNRMVDLRISNTKLYYRTLGIIENIMGVSPAAAKRALLRSLYHVDHVNSELMQRKPSAHVEAATNGSKIVPRALVMAGSQATCAEAEALMRKEPIVRTAIERLKQSAR